MVAKLFIERPKVGLRALLVFSSKVDSSLATLVELEELVGSAGFEQTGEQTGHVAKLIQASTHPFGVLLRMQV